MHVRAMVEVLGAARWTTIDFRESAPGLTFQVPGLARPSGRGVNGGPPPRLERRQSTSEMGASGSNAAAGFMAATKESLMFFVSKIRWPVELATDSKEGKLDECNRRYCTALIALMDGT